MLCSVCEIRNKRKHKHNTNINIQNQVNEIISDIYHKKTDHTLKEIKNSICKLKHGY